MLDIQITQDDDKNELLETSIAGKALLTIPQLNKGTAFSEQERVDFELTGKLPTVVETLSEQVHRCYQQYKSFNKQINRNIYLNSLLNTNQVLFYHLVQEHLEEMVPTIYTPIVGDAVKEFNKKYTQTRGLYVSYSHQDRIEEILNNRSNRDVELIVVSDGEGILGIGDQGIGGMAIPVAKLMVYTAFAGINPNKTLPILLDAGTNNQHLLDDPLYLGWRQPRVEGEDYDQFIDKFIRAVKKTFPNVFLHWEDFGRNNAQRNLDNYRSKLCSFNDDIQGTGAVAVAALLAALKRTHGKPEEQRIVIFGAGTAGMGITHNVYKMLRRFGVDEKQARGCFWVLDKDGLVTEHCDNITQAQQPYARCHADIADWLVNNPEKIELQEVVEHVKPTVLIGCSAVAGAFTEDIIRTMAEHVEHPIIFPLSNPPEKAEAKPQSIISWTDGKALIATGSPFAPVNFHGTEITISQCNNYLAFPGLGLAALSVKPREISDDMLWAASEALSQITGDNQYTLLPTIKDAKLASRKIAIAIAEQAVREQLTDITDISEVPKLVDENIWKPHYLPYKRKPV